MKSGPERTYHAFEMYAPHRIGLSFACSRNYSLCSGGWHDAICIDLRMLRDWITDPSQTSSLCLLKFTNQFFMTEDLGGGSFPDLRDRRPTTVMRGFENDPSPVKDG